MGDRKKINPERTGGIAEALKGADVCIALAKSGPAVKPEWWKRWRGRDYLCLRQPGAGDLVWEAKGGALIVATSRSIFNR